MLIQRNANRAVQPASMAMLFTIFSDLSLGTIGPSHVSRRTKRIGKYRHLTGVKLTVVNAVVGAGANLLVRFGRMSE
jgi:hypothetical protein